MLEVWILSAVFVMAGQQSEPALIGAFLSAGDCRDARARISVEFSGSGSAYTTACAPYTATPKPAHQGARP